MIHCNLSENEAAGLVAGTGTPYSCVPKFTLASDQFPYSIHYTSYVCSCIWNMRLFVSHSPPYHSNTKTAKVDLLVLERLRSSSSLYKISQLKLKFGEQSFSFSGAKTWNCLLFNLQQLNNTDTFKKQSKTHLFKLASGE